MALNFTQMGAAGWVARIDGIPLYLSDESGAVDRAQADLAAKVAASLPAVRDAASAYLDLFVDRTKACGRSDEPWWLDEIEFRDPAGEEGTAYALHFTLAGDDGGLWTVEMRAFEDEHRPFRFERRQG
ncbi:hypothetical protein [Methylobacterium sp. WL19]|uniref:hypothetical protein n=1 Tax=Methylobacterium sp. WL19 TaxID=2603896 RepID=UPI0011C9A759|nr:hypothetical protein [Methylobacterium sp. WL19]TXN20837.1 hypothetical protein FV220_23615 [Methylobacterium sp. WL19]